MQGTLPSVRPTVGIFGSRLAARPSFRPWSTLDPPLLFLSRIRDGRITLSLRPRAPLAACTLAKCSEMRGIWVDSEEVEKLGMDVEFGLHSDIPLAKLRCQVTRIVVWGLKVKFGA